MIVSTAQFIAWLFGWQDHLAKIQVYVSLALICIVGAIVIACGMWVRSCSNARHARLNEKQVQQAQKAIAKEDREQMTQILIESDVAEKHINENTANAHMETVNSLNEAKKAYAGKTNQELADELNRRALEQ